MVTRALGILQRSFVSPQSIELACIETYLTAIDGIFSTLDVAVGSITVHRRFQRRNTELGALRYLSKLRRCVSHPKRQAAKVDVEGKR